MPCIIYNVIMHANPSGRPDEERERERERAIRASCHMM